MYVPMSQTSANWAKVLADRQASTQKAYDFNAQQQADQALPNILFSLGQQNQQQQQGAQQPDMGSAPSQMGAAPITPVQGPQQIPPIGASQLTPPGQGGPQISRMNPGAIQPPTVPQMASAGADIQRLNPGPPMPQEQPQGGQNPGQQNPSGATPGYDLPSVVQAIKSQYPNIGGAALRNMMTTLNPLILTPAARAQLQMMKQQETHNNLMERLAVTERGQDIRNSAQTRGQDMRYGLGNLDPDTTEFLSNMYQKFGPSALAGLPMGMRAQIEKTAAQQGTTPEKIMQNLVQNKAQLSQATAVGQRAGNVEVAGAEAVKLAPQVIKASNAVPRDQWKQISNINNFLAAQQSDPKLAQLQVQIREFISVWARASTGKNPTVESLKTGADLLSAAQSQEAFAGVVNVMQNQIKSNYKAAKGAMAGQDLGEPDWNNGGAGDTGGIQIDSPPPPAAGEVQDGYRFKGGDPGDQNNWEPAGGQ